MFIYGYTNIYMRTKILFLCISNYKFPKKNCPNEEKKIGFLKV